MKEIEFKKDDGIKIVAEIASFIDSLDSDKRYVLSVKEKKNKRSLNANSYCWVLIDKIAEKTNIAKSELYKNYIKEIGGVSDTVCVIDSAVERLIESWERNGLGWQADIAASKIKGCKNVILYYGSSTYDTAQMSRLINLIVQDCIEFEIPTLDDAQTRSLIEQWENAEKAN